jgi:hypothetical protein
MAEPITDAARAAKRLRIGILSGATMALGASLSSGSARPT